MPLKKDNTIGRCIKNMLIALLDVAIMLLALVAAGLVSSAAVPKETFIYAVASFLFVAVLSPSLVLRLFVRADEVTQNVFQTIFMHFFVFVATHSLLGAAALQPFFLLKFYLFFVTLLCAERTMVFRLVKKNRERAANRRRVVLVGPSFALAEIFHAFSGHNRQVEVDGFFSSDNADGLAEGVDWLGTLADVPQYLDEHPEVQFLYCCHEHVGAPESLHLFQCCESHGVAFFALPANLNALPCRMAAVPSGGVGVFSPAPFPLQCWANRMLKRFFDLFLSLVCMLTVFPLLYLAVFAVLKRKSPGPVLVRQKHLGVHGVPFETFEFRTVPMPSATADAEEIPFAFGRFLQRTRLHRLPMLLNVLLGTMSFVGPSLWQTDSVATDESVPGRYLSALKPGLVGWAHNQEKTTEGGVTEGRSRKCNLWYAQNWTLWLDVHVLLRALHLAFRKGKG